MNYEFYIDLMNVVSNRLLRKIIFMVVFVFYHSTKVVGLIAMFKNNVIVLLHRRAILHIHQSNTYFSFVIVDK